MTVVVFDVETHLIRGGLLAPKLVCVSRTTPQGVELEDRDAGLAWFRRAIVDPSLILVGHNVPFDLGVLCAEDPDLIAPVFNAIDAGRVRDTLLRERLIDLCKGELKRDAGRGKPGPYSLAGIAERRLGVRLDKGANTWRLRYAELDGIPITWWPPEARKYACDDSTTTLRVYEAQDVEAGEPIPDEIPQVRASWALHLLSSWGVRTDAAAVRALRKALEAERDAVFGDAKAAGLVRPDGTRDLKAIRARLGRAWDFRSKGPMPATAKTRVVSTAGKHLEASGDELLKRLSEADHAVKLLGTYVKKLEQATRTPLNPRYTSLLETGRTSATDNAQTPPRKGGVRECFVPRESFVFAFSDYDGAEMRSWAQACLDLVGHSKLALRFQADPDFDPHAETGAILLGISGEEMTRRLAAGDEKAKEMRQFGKIPNFGKPGGMGANTLVEFAAGLGMAITSEDALRFDQAWKMAWPEQADYFRYVSACVGEAGEAKHVVQLRSGRVRGRVPYCATANGFFQGLVADAAKRALWLVSRECHTGRRPDGSPSPLAGSRPVMFLHDEIGAEVPEARAAEAAERMAEVMVQAATLPGPEGSGLAEGFMKDVPMRASAKLMRFWSKDAKALRDAHGRLVPWEGARKEKAA